VSLLAFVAVAGAGIRSFWRMDELDFGQERATALNGGYLHYARASFKLGQGFVEHQSRRYQVIAYPNNFLGFAIWKQVVRFPNATGKIFRVRVPLWFPLLLLLIAPVRWLIARPQYALAFPVVTDAKWER
jgi:hypothetical protein